MSEEVKPVLEQPGGVMTLLGAMLIIAGNITAGIGIAMDTSISSDSYLTGAREIVNLDLQQQQMVTLLAGCTALLAGVVLLSAGRIVKAISSTGSKA